MIESGIEEHERKYYSQVNNYFEGNLGRRKLLKRWQKRVICLIFKKRNRKKPKNYRGITLLDRYII